MPDVAYAHALQPEPTRICVIATRKRQLASETHKGLKRLLPSDLPSLGRHLYISSSFTTHPNFAILRKSAKMTASTPTFELDATIFTTLQPTKQLELLDVIDDLRAQGLNEHVDLPQLIVCGDQSSGKSSLLTAISGVPFPRKDNLCTRFATEVVLRRDDRLETNRMRVAITASGSRSIAERAALDSFAQELSSVDELPKIIADAALAMGLGVDGSAFSADILRLEVRGPKVPQLTIVDLPGLIHSENKFQTADDIALVNSLVEDYMSQERSIILAVVSAKYDYPNQIVLTKARKVDPHGRRTLGIITKPDTLHPGSPGELSFLELADNQDIKFSLGWHVVRNQDSNKAEERDRDRVESEFFETSRWTRVKESTRGIHSLRVRLSEVLFQHIQQELPGLISEILAATNETKSFLARMGRSRATLNEKRMFVMELGQKFRDLAHAACEGSYEDKFFDEVDSNADSRRLRAAVQNANIAFASKMLKAPLQITKGSDMPELSHLSVPERATTLINSYRGKELPGTFNPALIGQLFRELSRSWLSDTRQHTGDIWLLARKAVVSILGAVAEDHVCNACMATVIDPELEKMQRAMEERMNEYMLEFSRQPMTYNHYLTEAIQAAKYKRDREDALVRYRQMLESRPDFSSPDAELIVDTVLPKSKPDMDEIAAQTLTDYAIAYYKVALKRLIDEIPAHVVEPTVLTRLPKLLDSTKILQMSDELIETIGGESMDRTLHRHSLQAKLKIFSRSSLICKVYAENAIDPDIDSSLESLEGSLVDVAINHNEAVVFDSPAPIEEHSAEHNDNHPVEDISEKVYKSKKKKAKSKPASGWGFE
nr:interferon-induced gtp-binding protein mx [Quercus suber]